MTTTASPPLFARDPGGMISRLRRVEAWMDARGRKAWILAMILGFVFAWPIGLALVAYLTFTDRWSRSMFKSRNMQSRHDGYWSTPRAGRPSGNTAFDSYKAETLKRLEDEQEAFEAFMQRLRDAKDKSEFDAFMDDRSKSGRVAAQDTPTGEY